MLEYVPIKEYKQFLLKHGVVWDGKIFDEKNGQYKKVEMKTSDYGYNYRGGHSINAEVPNSSDKSFVMMVDETQLLIYEHVGNVFDDLDVCLDLSKEWRSHLVDNHIWQYGPIIRGYAMTQIERAEKFADIKLDRLNKKKKEIEDKITAVQKEKEETTSEWRELIKKTKEKYSKRLDSLCEVMTTLNPDIMVLEEIESEAVVQDICNKLASTSLDKKKSWQYTCFAKEPGTAIGSAVFSRLELKDLIVHSLDVRVHEEKQPSERPLMEVSVNCQNKLFKLFVCHWKSKSGGEVETEIWRDWQESLLSQRLQKCECAGIPAIVCGDFNRNAEDFIVLSKKEKDYNIVLRGAEKKSVAVYCPWISSEGNVKKEKGSYFYKNEWERIDNIFSFGDIMLTKFQAVTIPPLADDEGKPVPYKMYNESGFSDHLPLKCIILI